MSIPPIRNNLVVELHVPDFEVTRDFYSMLGFTDVLRWQAPTFEHLGYMVLKRTDGLGESLLNFYGGDARVYGQSYYGNFPRDSKRGYATEITFCVDDLDVFYESVKYVLGDYLKQELKEKHDSENTWRDFRVEDPWGFYLRFTEIIDWGQEEEAQPEVSVVHQLESLATAPFEDPFLGIVNESVTPVTDSCSAMSLKEKLKARAQARAASKPTGGFTW